MNNGGGGGAAPGTGAPVNLDSSVLLADAGIKRRDLSGSPGPLEPYSRTPHGLQKQLFHCFGLSILAKRIKAAALEKPGM